MEPAEVPQGTLAPHRGAGVSKIIEFTGITKLDLPPDRILENAKGKLQGVVLLGYDHDELEFFASSFADGGTVIWLLERCKQLLLSVEVDE